MADSNETSLFFAFIKKLNFEDVENYLQKWPDLKDALQNKLSPAAIALKTQPMSLKMYKILHQRGCSPTEAEWSEIELTTKEKLEINEIHIECAKHVGHALLAKSKQVFEAPDEKQLEYCDLLIKTFKHLKSIALIKPILELVAADAKLQIFLDFKHDGLQCADPRLPETTKGLANSSISRITVAAKKLLNDGDRKMFHGTFAHELCHHAMFLLYNNNSKPYKADDDEREKEFKGIIGKYRDASTKSCELVVANAFKNKVEMELIVRVPHLLAMYNEKELQEVEAEFPDLFEFYKEKTFKDLKAEIPLLEGKNQVKFFNESFLVLKKVKDFPVLFTLEGMQALKVDLKTRGDLKIISSNCVKMTMKLIYEKFKNDAKLCSSIIFADFSDLNLSDFRQQVLKLMESKFEPTLVVDCDEKTKQEVSELLKKFVRNKAGKGIVFVVNETKKLEKTTDIEDCTHLMEHLEKATRDMLLRREVNLQGFCVKLEEIVDRNWAKLRAIPLNDLMARKEVKIGEKIEFPEMKIHVERKFLAEDAKWNYGTRKFEPEPLSVNEVIKLVEKRKVFLLADHPGNGKSTEFKVLAKKLKENFPSCWVAYIDLKRFTKVFQENGKVSIKFDKVEEIATFLAEKVLNLESFEAEMFVEMFEGGRVILLMDGVDEISPSYNEFMVKLMVGIHENKMKNQLWIATRPQLMETFENKLKIKAMKLMEFSDENRREFFEKFFENKNKSSEVLDSVEIFFKELDELSRDASVSNPLLMQMISELFDDNSNFQLDKATLFSIYDKFVEKMIKNLANKGSEAEKDMTRFIKNVNIIECHQKKALEVIIGGHSSNDLRLKLKTAIDLYCKDTPKLPSNQMTRIGLSFDDGTGTIHFTHRTFAEFFVAQFFVDKVFMQKERPKGEEMEDKIWWKAMEFFGLKQQSEEAVVELWWEVMHVGGNVTRKFLEDEIGKFKNQSESSKFALKIIKRNVESHKFTFKRLAEEGCLKLIKFVSVEVIEDTVKLHALWLGKFKEDSILSAAARYQPIKFVEEIWNFAVEIFTEAQIKELLLHKDHLLNKNLLQRRNLLHYAIANNKDENIFEFFVQKAREVLNDDDFAFLTTPAKPLWSDIENPERTFSRCKKSLAEIEFKIFLKSTDDFELTLLHETCRYDDGGFIQTFLDVFTDNFGLSETKELLLKTDQICRTALMFAAGNKAGNVFQTLWIFIESNFEVQEQIEMMLKSDNDGWNAFHCSTRNENKENFEFVKKCYQKKFGIEKVKEILAKENSDGRNILKFAMDQGDNIETVEALWNFLQELFDDDTLKKILARQSNFKKIKFWSKFLNLEPIDDQTLAIFEPFIIRTCTNNVSHETFLVWHFVAEFYKVKFVQELASIVDQNSEFAASFYEKLFSSEDQNNNKVIERAEENIRNPQVLKFLKQKTAKF